MTSATPPRPSEPRARVTFADRSLARRTGLPKPGAYRVQSIRIPARDGVTFGADLYSPIAPSKGVLLTRGPYGRGATMARMSASVYAAQGYTVLFVSSRGTADPEVPARTFTYASADPTPTVGGPQFARSAATGENPLLAEKRHPNPHTVAHADGVSVLHLPVATNA